MTAGSAAKQQPMVIGGQRVDPGTRTTLDLPAVELYTRSPINMAVHVIHSRRPGPHLFVSAAVHGDELNGIEIVRRLMIQPGLQRLRGTLLAVPIVNVPGVMQQSRYLPDRRDLNRAFPGSMHGSLAARLAHLFVTQVVTHVSYGIDLHTGAIHRSNLPQIRGNLNDPETLQLAHAFGVPVLLNGAAPRGTLRGEAEARGVKTMTYEAGEALRFDELAITAGVRGTLGVMRRLGMLPARKTGQPRKPPPIAESSSWLRAPSSGIVLLDVRLGDRIREGQVVGGIVSPYHQADRDPIVADADGIIIGKTNIPLLHEGEAVLHVARFKRPARAEAEIQAFRDDHDDTSPFDDAAI